MRKIINVINLDVSTTIVRYDCNDNTDCSNCKPYKFENGFCYSSYLSTKFVCENDKVKEYTYIGTGNCNG